jgi:hypothetical protein
MRRQDWFWMSYLIKESQFCSGGLGNPHNTYIVQLQALSQNLASEHDSTMHTRTDYYHVGDLLVELLNFRVWPDMVDVGMSSRARIGA